MKYSNIELPSNKKFGFFFSFIFVLLGLYFFSKNASMISIISILLAIIFILISLLNPKILLPLNKLWMRFGYLLGLIVSPIVLGLLYFVIFTPISILTKLFGRDELNLILSHKPSYWKNINIESSKDDDFKNQF